MHLQGLITVFEVGHDIRMNEGVLSSLYTIRTQQICYIVFIKEFDLLHTFDYIDSNLIAVQKKRSVSKMGIHDEFKNFAIVKFGSGVGQNFQIQIFVQCLLTMVNTFKKFELNFKYIFFLLNFKYHKSVKHRTICTMVILITM